MWSFSPVVSDREALLGAGVKRSRLPGALGLPVSRSARRSRCEGIQRFCPDIPVLSPGARGHPERMAGIKKQDEVRSIAQLAAERLQLIQGGQVVACPP